MMGLLYEGPIPVTAKDERSQGHFKICEVTLLLLLVALRKYSIGDSSCQKRVLHQ